MMPKSTTPAKGPLYPSLPMPRMLHNTSSLPGPTLPMSHGVVEIYARRYTELPGKRRVIYERPIASETEAATAESTPTTRENASEVWRDEDFYLDPTVIDLTARTNQPVVGRDVTEVVGAGTSVLMETTGESVDPRWFEEHHEWGHEGAESLTAIQNSVHVNAGLRTGRPLLDSGRSQLLPLLHQPSPPFSEEFTHAPERYFLIADLAESGGIAYLDGVMGSEGAAGDQPVEAMSEPSSVMKEYWETGEWDTGGWDLFAISHPSSPNGNVGTGTEA